mgnify:CR=1 FL=1
MQTVGWEKYGILEWQKSVTVQTIAANWLMLRQIGKSFDEHFKFVSLQCESSLRFELASEITALHLCHNGRAATNSEWQKLAGCNFYWIYYFDDFLLQKCFEFDIQNQTDSEQTVIDS